MSWFHATAMRVMVWISSARFLFFNCGQPACLMAGMSRKARISHKNCNHAETSAANAQCRSDREFATRTVRPPEVAVVPRRRGDGGVVQGLKNSKRPNTLLRADHDLADGPRMLAYGCRLAWAADLDVLVGDRFNDEEARIVIKADKGEISLVWRDKRPDGIWKIR